MNELYWFVLLVAIFIVSTWHAVRYHHEHDENLREELKREYIAY